MRCLFFALLALLTWPAAALELPRLLDGDVVLYRHALAPGGGDPPGFRVEDCSTQRNLSNEGRTQARQIGAALRERLGTVAVTAVWASPWCRTRDTARLAFPDITVQAQAAFASFFQDPEREAAVLTQARQQLAAWRGPGVLVVVTHQVNITGLTGVFPASGEGVALRWTSNGVQVLGRLPSPDTGR